MWMEKIRSRINTKSLFLTVLFFGIFIYALKPVSDPDFWWHLKTGQMIFETAQIPHFDPFSFSAYGNPWIAHEWLSELIIYLLYKTGGYVLPIIVFAVMITAAFGFVYFRCPDESKPYIAGFSLLLGAIMSSTTWGVRPQVFSILNTSIFLYLLSRFQQDGKIKYLLPLPLIMLFWVNLHGAFILGMVLIAVFIGANVIDSGLFAFKEKSRISRIFSKTTMTLIITFVVCTLSAVLNPNGIKILIYPFQTVNDPAIGQFIQEWASPNFHEQVWLPLVIMILLLVGAGMRSTRPISTVNILLCVVSLYAVLHATKQISLFALVTIPVLSMLISSIIPLRSNRTPATKLFRWSFVIILIGCVFAVILTITQLNKKQTEIEDALFPTEAVDWVIKNKPQGNVFNAYNWGGYLIWRLYPEYSVYIDGRCDMYGAEFLSNYIDIRTTKPGWEDALTKDKIGWVFVEKNSSLANNLRHSPIWENAYEDDMSVIFLKNP